MLPSLLIIASQMMKTNKDFELAHNIMNALWVEDLDIDAVSYTHLTLPTKA